MIFLSGPMTKTVRTVALSVGGAAFGGVAGPGRQHAVELRHLEFGVADHRVVGREALRLGDVGRPALVVVDRIDAEADDLDAALVEFGLQRRHAPEFGGADRREILGVREKHAPAVAEPFVKADFSFGGVRLEIRRGVVDRQSHDTLLAVCVSPSMPAGDLESRATTGLCSPCFGHATKKGCARPRPAACSGITLRQSRHGGQAMAI